MKRLIYALPDGSVQTTEPGPAREDIPDEAWLGYVARKCCPDGGELVAIVHPDDLPKEHRDAWVWDGQRVVVDESRIKPKAAPVDAPPADLGPIRQGLSEKMAAVFVKMEQELNKKIAALEGKILQEADRRARVKIQALAVVNCVQTQEPIDLDAVPDLVAEVAAAGQPVTEQAIIEAADRHLAASIQAGRA